MRQIAAALVEALRGAQLIKHCVPEDKRPANRPVPSILWDRFRGEPGLSVVKLHDGRFSIALVDAPFYEQELFADALAELLGPIANPRYLLVRERSGSVGRRKDYHAVPQVLASNRERAQLLFNAWNRRVGPAELVYTRTQEGRGFLLKARRRAFSAAFADRTERRDRWQ